MLNHLHGRRRDLTGWHAYLWEAEIRQKWRISEIPLIQDKEDEGAHEKMKKEGIQTQEGTLNIGTNGN